MHFRICIGLPPHRICFDIPVLIFDWKHFHIGPPDPDPWRQKFEQVKPEVRKEIFLLSQISAMAAELNSGLKDRITSMIKEHVAQSLPQSLPKEVQVSFQ